ncbi:MAG: tRNA (adenosine(37)-N6)-threonylcarbamoyltransferase complex dimerization subunit type 1 TsaB [Rhodospirillales bacterium]|nr:tRNA (adenosine(37)-N6)-threonylcarbamoyltransferase complex dimerization subunit type 1 TsaB [Rhodospirillales bacterium]MSP80174.1 tRNA (adenosine(37)-N6)-threonylcarbamoyltransferase complex dimerization subunit type 1 TsaB [Rhodospirillales bacterium]
MLVLALDAAMSACSAALWHDGCTLARHSQPMERGHAEALMPMIERVMAEGGIAYAALDLVAATVGPGAFTGIRIGLAAARGLALAAQKPCAGVTTLEAIAAAARAAPIGVPTEGIHGGAVLAAIESRRADLFAQGFAASGAPLGPAAALRPEGLAEFVRALGLAPGFILAGDGWARARAALAEAGIVASVNDSARVPDPALVAAIAAGRHGTRNALAPRPLYLRPPDVTLAKES